VLNKKNGTAFIYERQPAAPLVKFKKFLPSISILRAKTC